MESISSESSDLCIYLMQVRVYRCTSKLRNTFDCASVFLKHRFGTKRERKAWFDIQSTQYDVKQKQFESVHVPLTACAGAVVVAEKQFPCSFIEIQDK